MKKAELEEELGKTQKEIKSLRRELNKLRSRWKYFDKVAKIVLSIAWVFVAWNIAQYAIGYGMIFILGYARYSEPAWLGVTYLLTYAASITLVILVPKLLNKKFKTSKEELGTTDMPTFTDIGIAILGYIASFAIALVIIMALSNMGLVNTAERQQLGFNNVVTGSDRAIAYIAMAVIAPIAEEIIFRGWLYGKLRKELSIIPAIILTSLLFGALHTPFSAAISVSILSVVMCIEREITGTIYAGIITHMIQNSIAFALLVIQGLI